MTERLYYRVGQAAHELKVSRDRVRRLCEAGIIRQARQSPGGQWEVPAAEVERLKREGVPEVPRPIPDGDTPARPIARPPAAEPADLSPDVADARDRVAIAEQSLKLRQIDRQLEEAEDWFRDREQQAQAELDRQREQEILLDLQARREAWRNEWLDYAVRKVPYGCDLSKEAYQAVSRALEQISPSSPQALIQRIVDDAIERALEPWRREQGLQKAFREMDWQLPLEAKSFASLSEWQIRGREMVRQEITRLGVQATAAEIEAIAVRVGRQLKAEYEHRHRIRMTVLLLSVPGATHLEQEEAKEALSKALGALPVGSDPSRFDAVKQQVLKPYADRHLRRQQAERRRQDAESRARAARSHVERYLEDEWEEPSPYSRAGEILATIEADLVEKLQEDPDLSSDELEELVEHLVDDVMQDQEEED